MTHQRGWFENAAEAQHECDYALCDKIAELFSGYKTIIDIGCGDGAYTKRLRKAGFLCCGYDGSPETISMSEGACAIADFSQPVDLGKFDLVLCLEVGEHVPKEYEQIFLDNVCKSSKNYVILSWAIKGQGGTGHVNEQSNEYVIDQMRQRGFKHWGHISTMLRTASTLPWFHNTVMAFVYE